MSEVEQMLPAVYEDSSLVLRESRYMLEHSERVISPGFLCREGSSLMRSSDDHIDSKLLFDDNWIVPVNKALPYGSENMFSRFKSFVACRGYRAVVRNFFSKCVLHFQKDRVCSRNVFKD